MNNKFLTGLAIGLLSALVLMATVLGIVYFESGGTVSGLLPGREITSSAYVNENAAAGTDTTLTQGAASTTGTVASDKKVATAELQKIEGAEDEAAKEKAALRTNFNENVDRLTQYMELYYDGDIDYKVMYEEMLTAMVDSLGDIYSFYYTPEYYEDEKISFSGDYCGIGSTVTQFVQSRDMYIVQPFENSPAEKAGLLPGDKIIGVDGDNVIGQRLTDVVKRMRGEAGTHVSLTILRRNEEGESEEITFDIIRDKIVIVDVYPRMLDDEIGYIYISEFAEKTSSQFKEAVDDLMEQGAKALVIDLRDNGGGYVQGCVDMLSYILPKGTLLITEKDKYGNSKEQTSTTNHVIDLPIAVLVNGNTASASEIFSAALHDNGRAALIGEKTFGKGIEQVLLDRFTDGSAVQLTCLKYYTPKGENIHGTGIEPDIAVELDEELASTAPRNREEDNQRDAAVEYLYNELYGERASGE